VSGQSRFYKILAWIGFLTSPLSDKKSLLELNQRIKSYGKTNVGEIKKLTLYMWCD
jgi:hypothetical protein